MIARIAAAATIAASASQLLFSAMPLSPPVAAGPCLDLAAKPAGASWTYAGTRLWSAPGGERAESATVQWTTAIVRVRSMPANGVIWLVRGFVTGLAWSDPTTEPQLSVVVCNGRGLFERGFASDSETERAFAHWSDSLLTTDDQLLAEPLRDGAVFAQNPPRSDGMYGWVVERLTSLPPIPTGCHATSRAAYRLTLRTLPDHQVLEWRAGVGVTRYLFGHHGTPAGADVRLIACHGQ